MASNNEKIYDRDVMWHDQETTNQKAFSNYDHSYPITNNLLYPPKPAGFRRFQTHAFCSPLRRPSTAQGVLTPFKNFWGLSVTQTNRTNFTPV